jgi:hypothetical protein
MVEPLKLPDTRICVCGCGRKFEPYRPQNIYYCDKCQETDYNSKHDIARKLREIRAKRKIEAENRIKE